MTVTAITTQDTYIDEGEADNTEDDTEGFYNMDLSTVKNDNVW